MKPMLAATVEDVERDLYGKYPLFASAKLDGIRCFVENGVLLSRTRKPIPNLEVQKEYCHLEHHDGELIVGPAFAPDVYRKTMSGVMSRDGQPCASFHVFDHVWGPNLPLFQRLKYIKEPHALPQKRVESLAELIEFEGLLLAQGYEGVILRHPDEPYKFGRSTLREAGMLKLKRFEDSEAAIIGFEELMHNANKLKTNALGYAERSSHQANLVPTGRLGALVVAWQGMEFNIGTGFDDALRIEIWNKREDYIGAIAKFKFLRVGMKDKPRHPVFLGFRSKEDM